MEERETVTALFEAFRNIKSQLDQLRAQLVFPDPASFYLTEKQSTGSLTLSGSYQDIPGATINLDAGEYIITGIFCEDGGTDPINDEFNYMYGQLMINGVAITTGEALCPLTWLKTSGAPTEIKGLFTVAQTWKVTIPSTQTVKLQARKNGGTGNSVVIGGTTKMSIIGVLA